MTKLTFTKVSKSHGVNPNMMMRRRKNDKHLKIKMKISRSENTEKKSLYQMVFYVVPNNGKS
jgi:hypothetical protein